VALARGIVAAQLWGKRAMSETWDNLRLDVVDDEIMITLPGTTYSVTYYKPPNSPQLLARNISQYARPRLQP
jgi:hypothetical protein